MKTWFYNRSLYRFLEIPIPQCFLDLDEHYGQDSSIPNLLASNAQHAENVCRRMADLELYANLTSIACGDTDAFRGALFAGSYMVGYFSACKSLLDAVAVALNEIHRLSLPAREQDFGKPKFWNTLKSSNPGRERAFSSYRQFGHEVIKWRDAAVHRKTPVIIVCSAGDPYKVPRDALSIRMVDDPNPDYSKEPKRDPADVHARWRAEFIAICAETCQDLR